MMKIRNAILIAPLMLTMVLPLSGQNRNYQTNRDQNNRSQNYQTNRNSNFYNGVRNGGRGGQYNDNRRYDDRNRNHGGIGPGKGALIGAGGGALLGALFGGGLKGTLIGGAAGAGIGAVVGKAHQDNERNNNDYRYDDHRRR
ncbi:hypothetical protein P8936_16185 [Edaphobacter paludis]|uniref:Glycine zipper domain-containing protein n=1 Tax=Edaphobacter paludis TaxID=3035702 RepID=A0AAU7D619_9BACT